MRIFFRILLRFFLATAVFCVLASLSPIQAQDELNWQPNVPVNNDTGGSNQWYPSIAASKGPNGGSYAAWTVGNSIYVDYRPKGGAWGNEVVVNDESLGGYKPGIAVDGAGNAYVIWAGVGGIYSTVLPPGGGWDPETIVRTKINDEDSDALPYADIAVDSAGNVHAVWYDRRLGSSNLYSDFRTASSGWGTDTPVNNIWGSVASAGSQRPSMTADSSGNVYAAWVDGRNGSPEIFLAIRNQGNPWSASEKVEGPSGGDPDIAVDGNGNVYAIWSASAAGGDIYFNYRPTGESFAIETVEQINDDTNLALQGAPAIGVDSEGNAYAVWSDRRNGFSDIFDDIYSAYRPAGGSWGSNILVNDDGGGYPTQTYPNLAVDSDGYAYAVWMDKRNNNWDIYFSTNEPLESEPIAIQINLPQALTKNEETGWYIENPIDFKVKVTNNTINSFSGMFEVVISDSSRLVFVDPDVSGEPLNSLQDLVFDFGTLNPGQVAEQTWSFWAQPMSEETIHFTAKVFDDADQLINQETASMFVPIAQIHPVVILPGWPGSFINFNGDWEIDPIKGTYDNLLEELQLAGYETDVSLFTFPYDWKRDANLNANELGQKIPEFLGKTTTSEKDYINPSQVDLVGHSGGGLVSRAYIQGNNYGFNVHRLITLGTPHRGTPKAYLNAEGLEFDFLDSVDVIGPALSRWIILSLALEDLRYCPLGVVPRCIHRFIEYEVPSVRQAFPTDDYLKDDPGGYLIYTDEPPTIFPLLHQYNGFLSSLNENIGVLINRLETNNVISVVGDRKTNNGEPIQDTHAYYTVTDRDSNDVFSGLWRNGKVLEGEAFRHQGRGDRTVPLISADLKMVNPSVKLETKTEGDDGSVIEHGGLPTQLQQSIVEQLTDTRPLFNAGFVDPDINLLKGAIMIGNFSPVEIQVTDPNGRRAGLDFLTGNEFTEIPGAFFSRSSIPNEPDFILIPDALDGDYLINLLGIDEGDYRVVMQSLGEQNILTLAEFSGSTSPGQEHEHSALYDSGLVPATPLSLEWLPPLENPDEPYEVAQDSILPISFTINDALGEFLDDDSVSVLIEDPSDASSAVVSFTSDVINIDNQEEKYSVDLNLFDYSFSQDSTYIVHARLFGEELGSSTFTVTSKEVGIDIWPGLEHNFIYFSRRLNRPFGVVPIVILSNNDFDAPEVVDKSSLTFGKTGDEKSAYYCLYRDRDYNRDGLEDLLCFFAVGDTGFQPGDTAGILKGKTKSGISIEGRDSVHIVTIR